MMNIHKYIVIVPCAVGSLFGFVGLAWRAWAGDATTTTREVLVRVFSQYDIYHT